MGIPAAAAAATAKLKIASLILAGTLAVSGVGAAGATAAASNGAFGQQVKAQVATCKADLKTGAHGIGKCVSTFAKDHGQDKREQHSHGSSTSSGSHGKSGDSHGNSSSAGGASNSSHGNSSNAGNATSHP